MEYRRVRAYRQVTSVGWATIGHMTLDDVRKRRAEAWDRISALVKKRSEMLRGLPVKANWAAGLTPATGMFGEFDLDQARDVLAKLEDMAPRSMRPSTSSTATRVGVILAFRGCRRVTSGVQIRGGHEGEIGFLKTHPPIENRFRYFRCDNVKHDNHPDGQKE
jgi:hypothetical protein